MNVCREVQSPDGKRVVAFIERADGLFSYREELGDADTTAYERYPDFVPWPTMIETSGIFGSLDEAMTDARDRVRWMQH